MELLCAALELAPEQYAAFLAAARKRTDDAEAGPDATAATDKEEDDGDGDALDTAEIDLPGVVTQQAIGGFLGALPDRPIVTREAEVRQIGAALDATLRGSAKIVFLAGEPGVGKTRLAERLAIARLSQEGTATLIATVIAGKSGSRDDMNSSAEPPTALVEAIHRSTDGNPFFTVEVLRALQQRGEMRSPDGHWEWRSDQEILVPESVQAAIDERLARSRPRATHSPTPSNWRRACIPQSCCRCCW